MASRRTNEEFYRNIFDRHLLYQLLFNMPQSVATNFTKRLGWLHEREFVVSPRIDWTKLGELGITMRIALYLTKTFTGDGFSFTYNGWKNVFAISMPIFQELCVEFFASVSLKDTTVDPYFSRALVFCVGGEYQE